MVMIGKDGKITKRQAIETFIGSTFFYLCITFFRELYSLISGKPFDEILTLESFHALIFFATLIYLGTLVAWCHLVKRSYKSWQQRK